MESKTLNIIINLPFNLRCKSSIFIRPFHSVSHQTRPKLQCFLSPSWSSSNPSSRFSPFCSLSERGIVKALPNGAGGAATEVAQNRILQVVLVSPQIPGNTGCIARTCAASAVGLHLVQPLGFQVDDTKLKRAGLDYWPYVVVRVHGSWAEFRDYFNQQAGDKRLLAFSKRGATVHSQVDCTGNLQLTCFVISQEVSYRKGDWLVFGSETGGLPPEALLDCKTGPFGGGAIRIPMVDTYVRCLNLSVSVGIALYEAARQLNYEQLQCPSEPCDGHGTESSFLTEDIFA